MTELNPVADLALLRVLQLASPALHIPLLLRQYDALERDDEGALFSWNDWLLANRETAELYLEDSQQGGALLRLLKSLAVPAA